MQRLQYTPPFGAAAAMIHPGCRGSARTRACCSSGLLGLGLVAGLDGEAPAARQVPRNPSRSPGRAPSTASARFFGPRIGPFVGHWLRFYLRNSRTRILCLISFPLLAFLTFQIGQRMGPHSLFVAALGTFADGRPSWAPRASRSISSATSGGAFRRYFLLPVDPAATLRAASYAAVTIGALDPARRRCCSGSSSRPIRFDCAHARHAALQRAHRPVRASTALGIWVTLFNPRKGNYNSNFGNDLSLGGNIVLIGGMMIAMFLPRVLYKFWPALVSPDSWWMFLPLPVLAAAFYLATLQAAGPIFWPAANSCSPSSKEETDPWTRFASPTW